jgi:hypothetical protein
MFDVRWILARRNRSLWELRVHRQLLRQPEPIPQEGDVGIIFISPTRSRASTPRQTMIGDSVEEFLTTPSGDGSFSLPSPRRCDTGASLTQITTTLWMENAPAAQAMMIVPPWKVAPWLETALPFKRCHARQGGGHQA